MSKVSLHINSGQGRMQLRGYQTEHKAGIYAAWAAGHRNVLGVLPTGSGKTVEFSDIIHENKGPSCAIAHRQELVSQIALALARDGVRHRIIGPTNVVRLCVAVQMAELGVSFFTPNASAGVAGVDTLKGKRAEALAPWLQSVTLWVMDEAHHVLKENKWGKVVELFTKARGLGMTATPLRADGKGLGRHADGVFDAMVEGPGVRELINRGHLTDYRIIAPDSKVDVSDVKISQATGDFNPHGLKLAVRRSRVIGDVVAQYLKHAAGKRGVTFATDVETAGDIAAQFNARGVPAAMVSAKTPDAERVRILRQFAAGQLLQVVNVDLFGEGFDLPALEVVSMARPTQSLGLYLQQFGRVMRPFPEAGKTHGLVIDHVNNVVDRHKLPDTPRIWSLDRREGRGNGSDEGEALKSCPECTAVYERFHPVCPHCGYRVVPGARTGPEFVDGDLTELDEATLARMRGEVAVVDEAFNAHRFPPDLPPTVLLRQANLHAERQEAQRVLRTSIAWWAGHQRAAGLSDKEGYRRFWLKYGMDVMTAQTLRPGEAGALAARIDKEIGR